jgi:hypothetical protein
VRGGCSVGCIIIGARQYLDAVVTSVARVMITGGTGQRFSIVHPSRALQVQSHGVILRLVEFIFSFKISLAI